MPISEIEKLEKEIGERRGFLSEENTRISMLPHGSEEWKIRSARMQDLIAELRMLESRLDELKAKQ